MRTFFSTVLLLCLLSGPLCFAQQAQPAGSNIPGGSYPQVDSQGRAIFRIQAPEVETLQVDLGKRYDMVKDDQGAWTVTTEPLDPGFHYYQLVVDGVRVSDPDSQAFYGTGRMSSGIEIPEPGVDFYTIKDVPHGDIRSKRYFSKVTNSWHRLNVYTPPGYDQQPDTRYPVLYLQHGGGEDETGWAVQGKTDIILDNLIAERKAQPMLVVMANGNVPSPGGRRGYSREGMVGIGDELIQNVVPFVEKNYRVLADAKHRALAGLSMGGGQTFYVGLQHPEVFASVGVFSSGLFGGVGFMADSEFDAEAQIPGLLTQAQSFNDKLELFYISVGRQDPRIENTRKAVATFKQHGLEVQYNSFPGGHEWQVWRKSLHDFAQLVFKENSSASPTPPATTQ
jgi:enterochelin esterase-like enzyme